jgi:very-short-patch-repair endonuclease
MKPKRTREYLENEYHNKKRSLADISQEHGTYPNKIRRELIYYGIPLRDKSEAQTAALESGRHTHPTKGTVRPDDIKSKIGQSVSDSWKILSEEQRSSRSQRSKDQWENMSSDQKYNMQKAAARAVRFASINGSKTERFIRNKLAQIGIESQAHKSDLLPYTKLVVDLYLPTYNTVIEIDGPTHFFPIWGEEMLDKQILADEEKNGILTSKGFNVLRVKVIQKNISNVQQTKIFNAILDQLNYIQINQPLNIEQRLIKIEVN